MGNAPRFRKDSQREQSQAEEIANSVSHGIALAVALVGIPFLIMDAARHGDAVFLVGTGVFSATILFLYLTSTIYHALPIGKAKRVFCAIEHSAIFLLIAGTYTPFMFGVLRGAWGWTLFAIIWSLAITGVMLKVFNRASSPIFSTGLYLLMGWAVIIAIDPLLARMPIAGFRWLVAGGLGLHVRCNLFRNRFAAKIRPLDLASVCDGRYRVPLFCRALGMRLNVSVAGPL